MNAIPKNEVAIVRDSMDRMTAQFAAALPAHIPVERFARVAMTAIQNNPALLQCSRPSLFNAAMKAAQDGLLPDGRDGAMVPYKGEVTWMPMVGGIRKKVRNSGEIATWDVHAVFANDEFEYELGDAPFIRHKPALNDRGALIAVYSIATLKSGEKSRDVMGVEDVEKIRKKSRSQNGPWADPVFYPEMAKKTVARRHSKVLPMSSDLDDLIRRDDHLYDFAGAKDEVAKARPRSLAGRLDELTAPLAAEAADPDTGEIIENPGAESSRDAPGHAPSGNASRSAPDGADHSINQAMQDGAEARQSGKRRRDVPSAYAGDSVLAEAWQAGFDGDDDSMGDAA